MWGCVCECVGVGVDVGVGVSLPGAGQGVGVEGFLPTKAPGCQLARDQAFQRAQRNQSFENPAQVTVKRPCSREETLAVTSGECSSNPRFNPQRNRLAAAHPSPLGSPCQPQNAAQPSVCGNPPRRSS